MEEKDQRFIANWKQKRQHKWRYSFRIGVLSWGLPIGLISYIPMILVGTRDFGLLSLIIQILGWGGAGLGYGYSKFYESDERYLRLIQSQGQHSHENS